MSGRRKVDQLFCRLKKSECEARMGSKRAPDRFFFLTTALRTKATRKCGTELALYLLHSELACVSGHDLVHRWSAVQGLNEPTQFWADRQLHKDGSSCARTKQSPNHD